MGAGLNPQAEIIRIFEMKEYPKCNHSFPCKREANGDFLLEHREEGGVTWLRERLER